MNRIPQSFPWHPLAAADDNPIALPQTARDLDDVPDRATGLDLTPLEPLGSSLNEDVRRRSVEHDSRQRHRDDARGAAEAHGHRSRGEVLFPGTLFRIADEARLFRRLLRNRVLNA